MFTDGRSDVFYTAVTSSDLATSVVVMVLVMNLLQLLSMSSVKMMKSVQSLTGLQLREDRLSVSWKRPPL